MLLVDGLVVMGAAGAVLLGVLGIRALRRRARPEIAGSENAQEVMEQSRRRCHFCRKHTDTRVDVFVNGRWYHRACFLNQATEEKTK
jgi:hypothetical protein